jgi:hypothetical protein
LEYAKVADTFAKAPKVGADAEVADIGMYGRFLKKELPEDVRVVFNHHLAGSRNPPAFQREGQPGAMISTEMKTNCFMRL